jgi:hypothetical protein
VLLGDHDSVAPAFVVGGRPSVYSGVRYGTIETRPLEPLRIPKVLADAVGSEDRGGVRHLVRQTRQDPSLRREADMMGFYVAVALIAALSTGSDGAEHTQLDVLGIVWGTTVGLALAHWFPTILSARMVHDPALHHTPLEMIYSQLLMAVGIALVATSVVVALPEDLERYGARLTAAMFIAGLVGFEARARGTPLRPAAAYGLIALTVGLGIATLKWLIST